LPIVAPPTQQEAIVLQVLPLLTLLAVAPAEEPAGARRLPLAFVANRGQLPEAAAFHLRGGGVETFVTRDGLRIVLRDPDRDDRAVAIFLEIEGGSAAAIEGGGASRGTSDHLLGDDPSRFVRGAPSYEEVALRDVLPGVGLRCYERDGRVEFDLELAPGVDPAKIALRVRGADSLALDDPRTLRVATAAGDLRITLPEVYAIAADGVRRVLESHFVLEMGTNLVRFDVAEHDVSDALVIDPSLVYGTFLGGALADVVNAVAVAAGSPYVAGSVQSPVFPTTPGTFDPTHNGGQDAFVAKLGADGSSIVWSTFIGGSANDFGAAIDLEEIGGATVVAVAGATLSASFPTTVGAHDSTPNGGFDCFVARFAGQDGSLLSSTLVGGSGTDGSARIVAAGGESYVLGTTVSANFPTSAGAFDGAMAGPLDLVVFRVSSSGALLGSTFLGGTIGEVAGDLAVHGDRVFVTGGSASTDFPIAGGVTQPVNNGSIDAFVTVFTNDLTSLHWSGFFGGIGQDQGSGIDVDPNGRVFVCGVTRSADLPLVSGSAIDVFSGDYDGFVARFGFDGATELATYLGGALYDECVGIRVASRSRVVVLGATSSPDLYTSETAVQDSLAGNLDGFVTALRDDLAVIRYQSYYGGTQFEAPRALAVDALGDAFIGGQSLSGNLPVTAGAYSTVNAGNGDGYLARIVTRTCAELPATTSYGAGKPGTLGIPQLVAVGAPDLGVPSGLRLVNGLPGAVPILVVGLAPAALPFDGGTLLVQPDAIVTLPAISANGSLAIDFDEREDVDLCGVSLHYQVFFVDPGAAGALHTAQSNAVTRELGSL
jgi:hypothetical protein